MSGRPSGSFTQTRRVLAVLSAMRQHPDGLRLVDVRKLLGVSHRSAIRYMQFLRSEKLIVSVRIYGGFRNRWRLADQPRGEIGKAVGLP